MSAVTPQPGQRVAVIGDVGGHAVELRTELARLGVADNGNGLLPEDLIVVQVGDLVHRGPESDEVVALVDRHLRRQPLQWFQLLGNHEAQYLRPPRFRWREPVARHTAAALRRWWVDGLLHAGVTVRLPGEDLLVTHAGVTAAFWERDLNAPPTAAEAAQRLDVLLQQDDDRLFRAGILLGADEPREPDPRAGPLWASAAEELLPGWLDQRLPFGQVHGHSSLMDWETLRPSAQPEIMQRTSVDLLAKHVASALSGGRIVGVDPGHGRTARTSWRAWLGTTTRPHHGQQHGQQGEH